MSMKKLLVVVDTQNDFITGSLGSDAAKEIVPRVAAKIARYKDDGQIVVFTRDTHGDDYLSTQEGRLLPVAHCVKGTRGWRIADELEGLADGCEIIDKPSFGSLELGEYARGLNVSEIEIVGLVTNICVVSNALLLKAFLPETPISVDASCCAGTSLEEHAAALSVLRSCHVRVENCAG